MSDDQETFDAECALIYGVQGYMVIAIDSPLEMGCIIGPFESEEGHPGVQAMRVIAKSSAAEYVSQCALVGSQARAFPGWFYYRAESD